MKTTTKSEMNALLVRKQQTKQSNATGEMGCYEWQDMDG